LTKSKWNYSSSLFPSTLLSVAVDGIIKVWAVQNGEITLKESAEVPSTWGEISSIALTEDFRLWFGGANRKLEYIQISKDLFTKSGKEISKSLKEAEVHLAMKCTFTI